MIASLVRPLRILPLLFLLLLAGCGGSVKSTTPESWSYVALGDSLAAGFTATEGYVQRYATDIQTDTGVPVTVQNLGNAGWTSSDLLNALKTDTALRSAVASANIVTWDIGGNDLLGAYKSYVLGTCGGADNQDCFRTALTDFEGNWDGIVTEILALRSPGNTIIRTMDVYNPFIAEQQQLGNLQQTKPYIDQVDAHIQASAQQNGIPCAKVYQAFNGVSGTDDPNAKGLIAVDQFHANDAGHQLMADLLKGLGYAPLK